MAQVSKANTEQLTYDTMIQETFSNIRGRPSRQDSNELLKEIEHVLVVIRVPNFKWSGKYGLLVEARSETEYMKLSGKYCKQPSYDEPTMTNPAIKKKWSSFKK